MDEMTLTLNSPITEEQWDMIEDVDFDHTDSITFYTKHGKEVEFVKRKTGKWIPDNTNMYEMRFVCSSCKESQVVPTIFYKPIWGWCPNCGASMMEGEQ